MLTLRPIDPLLLLLLLLPLLLLVLLLLLLLLVVLLGKPYIVARSPLYFCAHTLTFATFCRSEDRP